jgi:hypothetical protein
MRKMNEVGCSEAVLCARFSLQATYTLKPSSWHSVLNDSRRHAEMHVGAFSSLRIVNSNGDFFVLTAEIHNSLLLSASGSICYSSRDWRAVMNLVDVGGLVDRDRAVLHLSCLVSDLV